MAVNAPFGLLATRNLTVLIPAGIKDDLGNEVVTTNKTVTLKKDTIDPEIELVRVIRDSNDNVLKLVISTDSTLRAQGMVNAGVLSGSLTVVNPNGVLISSATWLGGLSQDAIVAGDKDITLSFASPGKLSGEYKITFASGLAADQAVTQNNLKSKLVELDFGPATTSGSFTILPGDVTSGGINIYDINYGGLVKGGNVAGSATDLANYTINGISLPVGTTITLDPTMIIAKITLPAESMSTKDPAALFTINNVQRTTGETIDSFATTVVVEDNVKPVMNSAVLSNDNRLIVGFSEALAAIPTAADFTIKINGITVNPALAFVAGSGSDAGKYVVDFNSILLNDGTQTYLDLDGDSTYLVANDIFVKAEASISGFSMKTSPIVNSLTIEVVGGATTDASIPANSLKLGTVLTAK